ncbi:helix-turn-helix domain-containing protein [Pedobacter sp. PACM 27299]|uniref:helix-turn-helix domain-containing protein n=1 Tax=Pedobacter sp. PACM 27299 TaxID=1727164 RepID=UPI000B1BCCF1|nr:helix-turn-helix domain-containing protein [Pedobacter sp. PACM 27299]
MHHEEFDPPKELQNSIKCFWYNRRESGALPASFEVVPDGYAEIIFHFGNSCSIAYDGGLLPLPSPFLIGLLHQPIVFHTTNRLEIIGIRCFPWMVFDLLGLPPGKDGLRVFEHPITQLQPLLHQCIEAGQLEEAVAHLIQYFLNLKTQITDPPLLLKAGAAIVKGKGTMPVTEIAAVAHATVRTLERKFKQSAGYTVKDVSGLLRFEQVRNHLWHYPDGNIASLAYELGYTDQSHLSREFKRYSGSTPAAFARKAKKRSQQ